MHLPIKVVAKAPETAISIADLNGWLVHREIGIKTETKLLPGEYNVHFGNRKPIRIKLCEPTTILEYDYWFWHALRRQVLDRDKSCVYCGIVLDRYTAKIDHLIPRSRGGSDDLENLVLCCLPCNLQKKDMLPLEYIQTLIRRRSRG